MVLTQHGIELGAKLLLIGGVGTFALLLGIIGALLIMLKLLWKFGGSAEPKIRICPKCLSMIPRSSEACPWCKTELRE